MCPLSLYSVSRVILVNLSKDVFERRTSTGSGFFSFLDSGFAHFLGQLVPIIVKTLRNTNLGASRCFKMKKTSLPVARLLFSVYSGSFFHSFLQASALLTVALERVSLSFVNVWPLLATLYEF